MALENRLGLGLVRQPKTVLFGPGQRRQLGRYARGFGGRGGSGITGTAAVRRPRGPPLPGVAAVTAARRIDGHGASGKGIHTGL